MLLGALSAFGAGQGWSSSLTPVAVGLPVVVAGSVLPVVVAGLRVPTADHAPAAD